VGNRRIPFNKGTRIESEQALGRIDAEKGGFCKNVSASRRNLGGSHIAAYHVTGNAKAAK